MTARTIWKFTIPVNELSASFTTRLRIPEGARLLHCAEQHGAVALWYEVDPEAPIGARGFQLFGTGTGPIDIDRLVYVGTTSHYDGQLILHVYEVAREVADQ